MAEVWNALHRGGRYVYAQPDELNAWLSKESLSRAPVHIATEDADLSADLKLAFQKPSGNESRNEDDA